VLIEASWNPSPITHHPSRITHHPHRAGRAGRGMNGERAPGPALSYVEGSALSYVEGVNRQTAGNLARRRRPQSGAVCKVQCDSNPIQRKIALPNPVEARWRSIVLYRTLHRFPVFDECGEIPVFIP